MLLKRVLTAVVGIPLALWVVYYGRWLFFVVVLVLALAAAREYYYAVLQRNTHPNVPLGYAGVLMLVVLGWVVPGQGFEVAQCLAILVMLLAALAVWGLTGHTTGAIGDGATTLAGALYPGLFAYVLAMRYVVQARVPWFGGPRIIEAGFGYVVLLLAVCWLSDTAAYFVGERWGTTRLAPRVSPGKTVEGALAGLATAAVVGLVAGGPLGMSAWHGLALGVIGGVLGPVGDLAASAIKRDAGLKDFPVLFPGHGGVLDRFDALLFSAPAFYFYVKYVVW